MIAIELTAAIDAAGTLETFYVSDSVLCTLPTDTPASIAFEPRLIDPGSLGRHAYSDGATGGATKLEVGEINISNADGALDGWLDYSFDARPVIIRIGTPGAYPAAMSTLIVGTADGIEASNDMLIVRLRDAQWRLDKTVCPNAYAGNNSLPNGLEGQAQDIKGHRKPKCYGKVYNVSPPLVNTSKLTYQVNDGAVSAIPAVYDRGLTLTPGADHANSTLLQAATPGAGTFDTCLAEGYFRLGSTPAGQIAADVTQGAASSNRTVAQILKQIALDAGLSGGEISSGDVTALDSANSAEVGIWLADETKALPAMDQIAASIGAWFGFDRAGILRMGQLDAPSGTPAATIEDYQINAIERRPARDVGMPAWRLTLSHSKNYTTQSSDLAGAVTADRRAWLAEGSRSEIDEDASIKTQWLLARELAFDGLLTAAADAATEAARRLGLYKVRRDVIEITVPIAIASAAGVDMMSVIRLIYPRYGCDAGRDFRLIGITLQLGKDVAVLTLWG